ncbi:MAG: phage tail protein [Neisseria sp.]|nr:phage tail protein [Neisseria sp.]
MGGKSSTISTSEQRILSLQVQQSSYGLAVPIIYGRTRVAGNLIWYGDFTAVEHTTTTSQGGKGGGGVTQKDTKYTYDAAVIMALAEGEIKGVVSVWREKERFFSLSDINLTLAKGGREQPVWGWLTTKHPDEAVSYSNTAYVYSSRYDLTTSAQIYNHNFEVDGKLAYGGTVYDANPRDILHDLLTNTQYGCNFPAKNLADTETYSNYCRAHGLFVSPAYTEQREAHQNITELLEQTNSAAVWSEGKLKIIPYGDAAASGNGAVYVPNLTPLYDLTDDDFIVSGAEDPVRCDRKTPADAFNQVQIEYLDRSNAYNVAVAEAKDQANIEQFGLRPQEPIQMHSICDAAVAHQVAHLTLQRSLYVRNEYEFKLGWKYCLLEPMDLVTLTDGGLGLDKTPVRITEIEEDEDGTLTIKAEDFPFGVASATSYPTQPSLGYAADYNVSPGNAFAPVMFEAPLQLTGNDPQIWLATAGGQDWGGASVWVSTDGDSYKRVGTISAKARYGSTNTDLPSGAAYDNVNTVGVDIAATGGGLIAATEQEARDLLTACYLGGEFIAYSGAELTGAGQYRLSGLVRGAWGSDISAHDTGKAFVRMDDALFKYSYPPEWLGKQIWVKLVSHNLFGSGSQNLADVAPYAYTIIGAPLPAVQNLRLATPWAFGRQCTIQWDLLSGADSYDIEIRSGESGKHLRTVAAVADNQYTYTLQDMTADGGQGRHIVFKVRARAITGKTGGWAQIVAQNPQLAALQGIEIEQGLKQAFFKCAEITDDDFAGIVLWASIEPSCPIIDANKIYDGADTFIVINKVNGAVLEGGTTYYLRAAGYDSFGKDALNISSSIAFTVFEVSQIAKDLTESNLFGELRDKIGLIDAAEDVSGSVNARVKAAADKHAADLITAATDLGSKITAVENVNATQAQQITTVTAAQNGFAAGLEAEKQARIAADSAEASSRETLATRIAGAESGISTLNQTVAGNQSATATQITQIRAQLDASNSGSNLIDASDWRPGYVLPPPAYYNGAAEQTSFVAAYTPRGDSKTVMQCTADATGQANGGFNHLGSNVPLNPNKTYRYAILAKRVSGTGSLYWGVTASQVCSLNTASPHGNPYFASTAQVENGVWYLFVGYVYPVGSTGNNHDGAGVWNLNTGQKILNGQNFTRAAGYQNAGCRAYLYYATAGSVAQFSDPMVHEVNGSEPDINALINLGNMQSLLVQAFDATINVMGKVSAMYSLKVEAVANGRKAVAGIALGADGLTGDTQFLVMAQKFAVVNQSNTAQIAVPFIVDASTNTVGVNGNLVVQGKAIIDKLNVGDIHGAKITANTITASHLQAQSITGDKIAAHQTLSAPHIIGGSLNIGSGRFTVNSAGQVSISAAAGNVGMKVTNERIDVYDDAGRLRVRLGKLS